ncbi:hypothetical protein [Shimia biformata]|uniref:hypothetical protein n=1 Tax=Shimia biformata TaxID=1294299 RepID=UPI001950AE11|nr:hypothetical protein [Shimia biformata]
MTYTTDSDFLQEILDRQSDAAEVSHLRPTDPSRPQNPEGVQSSIFEIDGVEELFIDDLPKAPQVKSVDAIKADLETGAITKYEALISVLFSTLYHPDQTALSFTREDLVAAANNLGVSPPSNIGDVLYAYRHRAPLPAWIQATATEGKAWSIEPAGRGQYVMAQSAPLWIEAPDDIEMSWLEDPTPGTAREFGLEGTALLEAILRSGDVLSDFLQLDMYHLQSQVRTHIASFGQVEIGMSFVGADTETSVAVAVQLCGQGGAVSLAKMGQYDAYLQSRFFGHTSRQVIAQLIGPHKVHLMDVDLSDGEPIVRQHHLYNLV